MLEQLTLAPVCAGIPILEQWFQSHVLLLTQLPTSVTRKAVDDGSGAWDPAHSRGRQAWVPPRLLLLTMPICKGARHAEKGRQGEGIKSFHQLMCSLKTNSQGCARPKPAAHVGGSDPSTWAVTCSLPGFVLSDAEIHTGTALQTERSSMQCWLSRWQLIYCTNVYLLTTFCVTLLVWKWPNSYASCS